MTYSTFKQNLLNYINSNYDNSSNISSFSNTIQGPDGGSKSIYQYSQVSRGLISGLAFSVNELAWIDTLSGNNLSKEITSNGMLDLLYNSIEFLRSKFAVGFLSLELNKLFLHINNTLLTPKSVNTDKVESQQVLNTLFDPNKFSNSLTYNYTHVVSGTAVPISLY